MVSTKKALVTGANGFVGSALCKELLKQGYQVTGVQIMDSVPIDDPNYQVVIIDPKELVGIRKFIAKDTIVFHLAWKGVSGDLQHNLMAQVDNLTFSVNLMNVLAECKCKRLVYSGSINEYENFVSKSDFDASHGNKLYSYMKNNVDNILETMSYTNGVGYVSCIIANIYGKEFGLQRFVTNLIKKMLMNEEYGISKGDQLVDFIYIEDVARAMVACAEKGLSHERYYVGSRDIKPLKEYIETIKSIVNPEYTVNYGELSNGATYFDFSQFDIDKLYQLCGFTTSVSFEEGIRMVAEYVEEQYGHNTRR